MWIIKIFKIQCFFPAQILNEHWYIYFCLQIPPRENWFQHVRRVYATAINFPCIITLHVSNFIGLVLKYNMFLDSRFLFWFFNKSTLFFLAWIPFNLIFGQKYNNCWKIFKFPILFDFQESHSVKNPQCPAHFLDHHNSTWILGGFIIQFFIHSFAFSFIYLFINYHKSTWILGWVIIQFFIHPFIHSSFHLLIHSFIYSLFFHIFIHSSFQSSFQPSFG